MRLASLLLLGLSLLAGPGDRPRPLDRVNPFLGTKGEGHTFPGPTLPFGFVQLGPDTRRRDYPGCAGYRYEDSRIAGFSHTHLSGTGIPDYADVLLQPFTGEVRWHHGLDGQPGYASRFSHGEEGARPGSYWVRLQDSGVKAELTATLRTGMHRYTYPAGQAARLLIDLEHRDAVVDAALRRVSPTELEGHRISRSWAKDQHLYFVIRFDRPFTALRYQGNAQGKDVKAALDFGPSSHPLRIKVGLSAVDVAGARRNLDSENPGWDFDAVRAAAESVWDQALARITVEGGTEDQQRAFATALYHSLLAPNTWSDADGRYRGHDRAIHQAQGRVQHTVFSLWDTFRAFHPLMTLTDRKLTADWINSMLAMAQEGGRLPIWELAGTETGTMIGYHAVPVIADAILKEIPGFDREAAFQAMLASAMEDDRGLRAYRERGYLGIADEPESVSKTLEYAFDDWCIARAAHKLGKAEVAAAFLRRAQSWKSLFDPATGFFRPRDKGAFARPFNPFETTPHLTEGNSWHYAFFVPHDLEGLIRFHGGGPAFCKALDALFAAPSRLDGHQQEDIVGFMGQYVAGNEPSHHVAFLYAYGGEPWKAQAWSARLRDHFYSGAADGLPGNEDCGQMSAWYLFAALGFYPACPGSDHYVLGSPRFSKATLRMDNGNVLVVTARRAADTDVYVQELLWNGQPLRVDGKLPAYLRHDLLAGGGELEVVLGPAPRTTGWALPVTALPADAQIPPAPVLAQGDPVFQGRTTVALACAQADAEIHFTLDGTEPAISSARYQAPFFVEGRELRAAAFQGGRKGPELRTPFTAVDPALHLTLATEPKSPFAADGPLTLLDGLHGLADYHAGSWLGFEAADFAATLDLGRERTLVEAGLSCLQARRGWIVLPRRITVEGSLDGRAWEPLGEARPDLPIEAEGVHRKALVATFAARPLRYLRVRAQQSGPLRNTYVHREEDSWILVDELIYR